MQRIGRLALACLAFAAAIAQAQDPAPPALRLPDGARPLRYQLTLTLSGIERFLGWLHSKHLAKRAPEPATESPQAAAG